MCICIGDLLSAPRQKSISVLPAPRSHRMLLLCVGLTSEECTLYHSTPTFVVTGSVCSVSLPSILNVEMPRSAFTIASYCRARCLRASVGLFHSLSNGPTRSAAAQTQLRNTSSARVGQKYHSLQVVSRRTRSAVCDLFAGNFALDFVKKVGADSRRLIGIQAPSFPGRQCFIFMFASLLAAYPPLCCAVICSSFIVKMASGSHSFRSFRTEISKSGL